ncbi:MAG: hypothetical protein SCH71_05645 [Desulfobulbaceae bacterium]|nr:hypothetical protein [Desulfobulbaceae bacterium]
MSRSLDKEVEELLRLGKGKKEIYKRLQTPKNKAKLVFYLNNKSTLARRKEFMWINLFLSAALLGMTIRRLLAISITGHFDFFLFFDFIVPTINFYVLREILLFQRTGYQFLAILTGLALIYPENRIMPDLLINLGMIALALFLYFRIFPKQEVITLQNG